MRQHYALDTAALLLAGADPTSIDTEQPETVLVSQSIYSFKYHREALSWRARLVDASLSGELSVSIDNKLGFVGAWENDYRWVPMPINEASVQVCCYELRRPDIFFDIKREVLAAWVGDQGIPLPSWLENTNQATSQLSFSDAGWWYVVPMKWCFSSGKFDSSGTPTGILKKIEQTMALDKVEEGRRVNPRAESQRLAVKAALVNADIDLAKKIPSRKETKQIAAQLLALAAKLNGCAAVTDEDALFKALEASGIQPPSIDQLSYLTTEM